MTPADEFHRATGVLWMSVTDSALRELLPRDAASLSDFYPRLQRYVSLHVRASAGSIDAEAIVRGEIVYSGEGSRIEAGAIIHESCRLILGPRSVVRAGSLLRDEVVVGADCLVGANCEVSRSVLLGPDSALGHSIVFNDSIAGAGTLLSAFIGTANTHLTKGREISIRTSVGRLATARTYLGALLGDAVRIGPNSTISPGTIVMPGLRIPPGSALLGIVDAARQQSLMTDYCLRAGIGE
jgi:NDP-sugar pyrophosphorylase family protein